MFGLRPVEAWNPVSPRKKDCGAKSLKRLALGIFVWDRLYGIENTNFLGTVEPIAKTKSIISYKQTASIQ